VKYLSACLNGAGIAASSDYGIINIWKLKPNKAIPCQKLSQMLPQTGRLQDIVVLSPHHLGITRHNTLQIWNTQNKKCIATLQLRPDQFLRISPIKLSTGNIAVCCKAIKPPGSDTNCINSDIILWNTTTQAVSCIQNVHDREIAAMVALPYGLLATTAYVGEKIITVWDTNACKPLHTLRPYCGNAYSLCALSNGTLASGAYNAIDIWDPIAGKRLRTLHHKTIQSVDTLLELPFGRLAAGSNNITIWDVAQGVCLQTLPCDQQIAILKSLSTGALLSADSTGKITIWNSAIHPTAFSHQKPQSYCRIS
jgi:WD40 repeat protein